MLPLALIRRDRRWAPSLVGVAFAATLLAACSSSTPNQVEVVEGTTTTVGTPTTTPATVELGEPTLTEESSVTTVGIDEIEFGMTVEEAEQAAGTRLIPVEGETADACYRVAPEQAPEGISFLVADGRVERVDIDSGPITTRSGAGIGMSIAELTALFPDRTQTTPSPNGTIVTFVPSDEADAEFRIIFDTDGTSVTAFRSGRLPVVTDGC